MCECVFKADERFRTRNTELVLSFNLMDERLTRPILQTRKVEPRKRESITVLPTYCPFCGERYEPEPAEPAEGEG